MFFDYMQIIIRYIIVSIFRSTSTSAEPSTTTAGPEKSGEQVLFYFLITFFFVIFFIIIITNLFLLFVMISVVLDRMIDYFNDTLSFITNKIIAFLVSKCEKIETVMHIKIKRRDCWQFAILYDCNVA